MVQVATTLPNKEGSWVLGLQGSVAKILQNPVPPCYNFCETTNLQYSTEVFKYSTLQVDCLL